MRDSVSGALQGIGTAEFGLPARLEGPDSDGSVPNCRLGLCELQEIALPELRGEQRAGCGDLSEKVKVANLDWRRRQGQRKIIRW